MSDICNAMTAVRNDDIIATCTLRKLRRALEAKATYSDQDRASLQWVYDMFKVSKLIEDEYSDVDFGGKATFIGNAPRNP